jgi:hypothetical protein
MLLFVGFWTKCVRAVRLSYRREATSAPRGAPDWRNDTNSPRFRVRPGNWPSSLPSESRIT